MTVMQMSLFRSQIFKAEGWGWREASKATVCFGLVPMKKRGRQSGHRRDLGRLKNRNQITNYILSK